MASSEKRRARRRAPSVLIACQRSRSRQNLMAACGHAFDVADGAEGAGLAVAHDFRKPAGVRADHRHARRQRLERAQAERLALRRQQEEIRAGQQRRHRIDLSEEEHAS